MAGVIQTPDLIAESDNTLVEMKAVRFFTKSCVITSSRRVVCRSCFEVGPDCTAGRVFSSLMADIISSRRRLFLVVLSTFNAGYTADLAPTCFTITARQL